MARTRAAIAEPVTPTPWGLTLVDAISLFAFLALTFLLGVFPLNDTDFWWHLRTGDLIRETGEIPAFDTYLYGGPSEKPWIDLHWGFELLLSWGFAHGGVVFLNLAKCVITTFAVFLLVTSRQRDWPLWVMLLAWLPALFVLGGRMYIRPETLTLLYMSIFLAILFRWERSPWLAFALPVVQVFWVNSQGLFVLGPGVLVFALLDAALTRGAFQSARRNWWTLVLSASALTGVACLLNPYGLLGALFPLHLLGTMSNPVFSESIAELQSLPSFIQDAGLRNVPLILHLTTMILGALSFVVPLTWRAAVRVTTRPAPVEPERAGKKKTRKKRSATPESLERAEPWRLSPFRLLLFLTFSLLSWKATRNSHQFATVVGTVTAWNFGEWAAAVGRHRREKVGTIPSLRARVIPRVIALGVLLLAISGVASGAVYQAMGEGRTIGLGERPLWFPHDAVKFAGRAGMPERFLCFHNGHASLFEYYHGPRRKVFADARLEVIGPELYSEYIDLQRMIAADQPGWTERLQSQGNPGVLVDMVHARMADVAATLMAHPRWRCVWFDPIAAVFVHESYPAALRPVDFTERHFRPDPETDPHGEPRQIASALALRNLASILIQRSRQAVARPLVLLGHGYAHRALRANPDSAEAWKLLGQIEQLRDPLASPEPIPRYRMAFDPIHDLSIVRATVALRNALERGADDFTTLGSLANVYRTRGMLEASIPILERLTQLTPINRMQANLQSETAAALPGLKASLGSSQPASWKNLSELDRAVSTRLDLGRVEEAARLLEDAYGPEGRTWELIDRIATLRLHLGQTDQARALWQSAVSVPRPALKMARVAVTYLAQDDYTAARGAYHEALAIEPGLFEALYGLAVLEADAGRRAAARAAAKSAMETAPSDVARTAVRELLTTIEPAHVISVSR